MGYDAPGGEPEMNLSSNADQKMINAVKKVCDMYKGQGHAQVELLPFLTKVIEIAKKPVNLADLIAINKKSQEIQSMIDSIDEKKVKFKNMSVKNEDPAKAEQKKDATVGGMASRAAGRSRGI
jgi:Ulp1 family protease